MCVYMCTCVGVHRQIIYAKLDLFSLSHAFLSRQPREREREREGGREQANNFISHLTIYTEFCIFFSLSVVFSFSLSLSSSFFFIARFSKAINVIIARSTISNQDLSEWRKSLFLCISLAFFSSILFVLFSWDLLWTQDQIEKYNSALSITCSRTCSCM